jgi:hypothetical protein
MVSELKLINLENTKTNKILTKGNKIVTERNNKKRGGNEFSVISLRFLIMKKFTDKNHPRTNAI